MNKFILVSLISAGACAAHAETFVDDARVVSVQPQYESVTVPRNACSTGYVNEVQRTGGERNYGGAVIGGVAGALIGNQVGGGHGREAATAVGAVVGALTGDNLANRGRVEQYQEVQRPVTTCQVVNETQTRLAGYRVQYHYRGQTFTRMMDRDPGPVVRVRVSVDPA